MPGIQLNSFANHAQGAADSRFTLDDNGGLQSTGKRNIGNLFTRAWDCMTRSDAQVAANKAAANSFVSALREEYGDEIANVMSRDLQAQVSKGRPLTGYRIEQVLAKADRMSTHIQAQNGQLLDGCLPALTDWALRVTGGSSHPSVLGRAQTVQVLRQAIEGSQAFQQHAFQNAAHMLMDMFGEDGAGQAAQEFFDHFKGTAKQALEHEVSVRLMPGSTALRDTCGDDVINHCFSTLPGEEQGKLREIEAYLGDTIKESLRMDGKMSPSKVGVYVGMHEYLESSVEHLSGLDTSGMSDVEKSYVDAMRDDALLMQGMIKDRLGLQGLTSGQMRALTDVNRDAGMLEQDVGEGRLQQADQACRGLAQSLGDSLEILRGVAPGNAETRMVLTSVMERGESALSMARDLPGAVTKGLRSEDMVSSSHDARDVLARLGEGGFDGPDIAWMHAQGLNVGDTVMRFSSEQIQLLKVQGLSIELGLQYLDKGVPIHQRTLVDDYRDELIVGVPKALGGGQVSKPYDVTYGRDRMVYKEPQINPETGEESGFGPSSRVLGIDPGKPQMTVRNVATRVVDELLGFNLVPDTRIGVLDGKLGLVMGFAEGIAPRYTVDTDDTSRQWGQMVMAYGDENPDLLQSVKDGDPETVTVLMDLVRANDSRYELGAFDVTDTEQARQILQLADGSPDERETAQTLLRGLPGKIEDGRVIQELRITAMRQRGDRDLEFDDPVVRQGLVKLQLLDALTAQGDRHQANYIVTQDAGGRYTGVVAIDNDQAFGTKIGNPNDLLRRVSGKMVMGPDGVMRGGTQNLNGVMLPGVVDRDMKAAFDEMTPEALRAQLAGLLPDQEIELAAQRLAVIKSHLQQLERNGMVIDPADWGGDKVTAALQDEHSSYVARDRKYIGQLRQEEDLENQASL
ncbi:hypothetical protein [Achromobacter agilis]|uniref:PI3K/PI4K catalytic domain-containing protein n=1 Tax=Achromobacter agilis TaxID=1353888 RepID=A0A446CCW1_9BURK|nr:hypothetical protein [Achromobacter agilis]SSW65717.1 hypothetical protein AGI3411_02195 [Achromobacter agilis]